MTASSEAPTNLGHTPLAWAAVGLASASAVLVLLGIVGLGGGGAGAVLSLAAFVTAVVAKARHERWALLWLPLLLLPALLVASPFWV
jgi:hypothetical protein